MRLKNILVTGGLGFIGFNALQLWKKEHPEYNYFVIDKETYAASFKLYEKKQWLKDNNIELSNADICDEFAVDMFLREHELKGQSIDTIVNFAAESHVDNSISNPDVFFQTNVIGTTKLLNLAKDYNLRFHQIGTDEVYGETQPCDWVEEDQEKLACVEHPELKHLVPSSPYSSSKASADMIALAYHRTYGTKVTVSRCTNNFGPYQHVEKLIGTVSSKALKDQKIPVYGQGFQRRHWIHVDEHNRMIMKILEQGEIGRIYNIAPPEKNWIANIDLIKFILEKLGKPESLIEHVTDRLGHDTSYFLYGTDFCQSDQNWKEDMAATIEWYVKELSDNA